MKKLFCISIIAMIWCTCADAKEFPLPVFNKTTAVPSATFDKMWIDYDITEDGVKGMRIHVKFTAYDMLNMDAYMAIYFAYDGENGVSKLEKICNGCPGVASVIIQSARDGHFLKKQPYRKSVQKLFP